MKTYRTTTLLLACAAVLGGFAASASAETYILQFTELVAGSMPGGTNVATLTIEDTALDTVLITLAHNAGSTSGQFVSDLWLNLDPFVVVTPSNQTPLSQFDTWSATLDSHSNVGLHFDLHQTFFTNAGNRFEPGESISFNLSGSGLNAADFLAFAPHEPTAMDNVIAMVHIQGVGAGGLESGKLAVVPEPASLAVLGLGLAALLRRRLAK